MLACSGLGVLFDTCVFVPCVLQVRNYPAELLQVVREGELYIVVCIEVVEEYVDVANRDYLKSGHVIRQMIDNFVEEGILRYAVLNDEATTLIQSSKDQIMVNCACSIINPAHLIVTQQGQLGHFCIIRQGKENVVIVSLDQFLNRNYLESQCRDCKQGR